MIDKTYLIILKQKTKMRKILTYAVSALALASCSSDSLVSDSPANTQAPIAFNAGQKNITRGTNFETVGRYNFGVWAYKTDGTTPQNVMSHYLVGYAGTGVGYEDKNASASATSKWFYQGLGKAEYSSSETGVATTSTSVNNNQYLRYWDHAYANTIFYAYAPYSSEVKSEAPYKIEVPASVNASGTTAESDFVYAGNNVAKASYNNEVSLAFKHLGAKVNLKFYEDIAGSDVKLINVTDAVTGIQLTPAKFDETQNKNVGSEICTAYDAIIDFSTDASKATVGVKDGSTPTKSGDNLEFVLPSEKLGETSKTAVASGTTYYAVAQPDVDNKNNTGFTLHVSFELTAKDNDEKIVVRDARVFVPGKDKDGNNIAVWQPNTAYTYTFKITTDVNGTTDPDASTINPTSPEVPTTKSLHPIVFDDITIEEYTTVDNESKI